MEHLTPDSVGSVPVPSSFVGGEMRTWGVAGRDDWPGEGPRHDSRPSADTPTGVYHRPQADFRWKSALKP